MLKPLTLAAVLLAAAAPMAHAQDSYDDGNDRYEQSDSDDGPRGGAPEPREEPGMNDMRHGDRWARERDGDRDMGKRDRVRGDRDREARRGDQGPRFGPRGPHGPGDRRGPPPPRTGFEIRLGMGQSIRVDCGDEPIARCVDAAQPVLDAMEGAFKPRPAPAGGPDADRVPPPPANLVEPDAGDGPDTPDVPDAPTPPAAATPAN